MGTILRLVRAATALVAIAAIVVQAKVLADADAGVLAYAALANRLGGGRAAAGA